MNGSRKQVCRILALGHAAPDEIKRISRGEFYTCVDGGPEEHEALRSFCDELTAWLDSMDLRLDDLSPEELSAFLGRQPSAVTGE